MTGKTDSIDRSKLVKPVVPVLLTLLAGLGGGIFALKSDRAPSDSFGDAIKPPADLAGTSRSADSAPLVTPDFTSPAALPLPVRSSAKTVLTTAPPAPLGGTASRQFALGSYVDPITASLPVAAEQAPFRTEVPLEIAAPAMASPAVAAIAPASVVVAVPVVQTTVIQQVAIPADDLPKAAPDNLPAAALADNAAVAVERLAAASSAPVAAPEITPVAQLAVADWNYSLPEQAPAGDRNAFAAAAGNAPITLVPSRAAPVRAGQRPATGNADARARLATPADKVPAAVGNRKIAGAGFASALHGKGKYQLVGSEIEFQLPVVANGAPVGDLTLHVAPNQQVSLRLRELLALFHDQIDPVVLTTLVASPSIESFVTFDKLRDAGIDIRYDAARDRLALSVEQP